MNKLKLRVGQCWYHTGDYLLITKITDTKIHYMWDNKSKESIAPLRLEAIFLNDKTTWQLALFPMGAYKPLKTD